MRALLWISVLILASGQAIATPASFDHAKKSLRQQVYHDRTQSEEGTLYCGCQWRWVGTSGGRVDLNSCGYTVRKNENRAQRIEWEHVVPAWVIGHQRQCWQKGGRKNCAANDPVFRAMEADMHNLAPAIGEVNADRSNYNFGMLPSTPNQYGQCATRTNFKLRTTEPRDEVKGKVTRIYFYMADRYGLSLSRQQQRILMAWHRQFPVTDWEIERDRRISSVMGNSNPFVTGERTWSLGFKPTRDGLIQWSAPTDAQIRHSTTSIASERAAHGIVGNRNSRVYHFPAGCPSYDQVKPRNRVYFSSQAEAEARGYRLAGNCR